MKRLDILHFLFDENDKLYGNTVSQDKILHYICEKNNIDIDYLKKEEVLFNKINQDIVEFIRRVNIYFKESAYRKDRFLVKKKTWLQGIYNLPDLEKVVGKTCQTGKISFIIHVNTQIILFQFELVIFE